MPRIERDILVMATKRSGHHAIMQWILAGMPGEKIRFNHISSKTATPATQPLKGNIKKIIANANKKDLSCFMYNVEHARIEQWNNHRLFKERAAAFGLKHEVVRRDAILVVRDPFNCLASAIKSNVVKDPKFMVPILKKHYQQALGDKKFADCYVINFNKWFECAIYRTKIKRDLGLHWIDPAKPHRHVPPSAQGSSFDKQKFHGRGNEMKVLDRWQQVNRKKLEEIVDQELQNLSERLFGFNPFQ